MTFCVSDLDALELLRVSDRAIGFGRWVEVPLRNDHVHLILLDLVVLV